MPSGAYYSFVLTRKNTRGLALQGSRETGPQGPTVVSPDNKIECRGTSRVRKAS